MNLGINIVSKPAWCCIMLVSNLIGNDLFMYKKAKDSFVPHEGNNYAPHILQRGAMLGMLGLVLLSFLIANFQALLWQGSGWLVGAILPAVVTENTNIQRQNLALKTLTRSSVLDKAAQMKADDMAKNSYFAHESPTGVTPWYWFDQVGYFYTFAGENLAVYFTDSGAVVDAWMLSPSHRANITNSNYTEIGTGSARGVYKGYDTVFVVQFYGAPAMKSLLPQVPNQPPVATAVTQSQASTTVATTATTSFVAVANSELVLGAETSNDLTPNPNLAPIPASTSTKIASDPIEINSSDTTNLPVPEEANPPTSDIPRVVVGDKYVSLYLDNISTSTNLTPLPESANLAGSTSGTATPLIGKIATQPRTILQLLYIILGTLVAGSLLASVLIEWRRQQLIQVSYGVLLLLLMSGLFYVHMAVTAGVIIS